MAGNEDWRRQRADELRLHDAGPFATRPARELQRPVDGVEPMRRPVVVPEPVLPAEIPSRHRESGRGAEPAARRYRQQSPLLAGSATAAPVAALPVAPRAPSFAARHPLALGTAIGAALAAGGALGWVLRAEIAPMPRAAPAATKLAPVVSPVHPWMPRSAATALPASPVVAAPSALPPPVNARASTPAGAVQPDVSQDRLPPPSPVAKVVPTQAVADLATPLVKAPPVKSEITAVSRRSPEKHVVAVEKARPVPARNTTSRFAHPAKAVALPGRDFHPSFNCRRAIAAVNRAICANPELAALDRQVSQTFYRATAKVDLERHKTIDREQVDFLNQRARCTSDDCVADVYRQRLDALRQAAPGE